MNAILWILATGVLAQKPDLEPEHAANRVYKAIVQDGVSIDGTTVQWPAPLLRDGQSAEEQRAALKKLLGSDQEVNDLLRNSVTAPQVVKVHDEPSGGKGGTIVRSADVWFVVYADLGSLDPEKAAERAGKNEPVEAANMRFKSELLKPAQVKESGLSEPDPHKEWYAHVTGDLLYRIHVEATDQTFATQSTESVVVASRTVREFDKNEHWPNRWWPVTSKDGRDEKGPVHVYAGGASTVKISRLKGVKGALLVESHFAFAEPKEWFDGAPILRSKIVLVAQDQVRRLRRELAKEKGQAAKSGGQ
jgi:hypothetical protein